MPDSLLWCREEVFDIAKFPLPHNTFTINALPHLARLFASADSSRKYTVSFTTWAKIATQLLHFSNELAQLVFTTFTALKHGQGSQTIPASVDGPEFLAFLFTTLFHTSSFRTRRNTRFPTETSPTAPFPSPHSPASPGSPAYNVSSGPGQAEYQAFVSAHLVTLLSSLSLAVSGTPAVGTVLTVSPRHINALGIFLSGGDGNFQVSALSQLVPELLDASDMIPVPTVVAALNGMFRPDIDDITPDPVAEQPPGMIPREIPTVISGQLKSTVVQSAEGDLVITDCTKSTIYILSPVRTARISGCSECTIVIGAVSGVAIVQECTRMTIIAATTAIHLLASTDSTAHLICKTRPAVLQGCRNVVFGPYNTVFDSLDADLTAAGLSACVNQWDRPVVIGADAWSLQDPGDFYPFVVPFNNDRGMINPASLPEPYASALRQRIEAVSTIHRMVRSDELSRDARAELNAAIQRLFKMWLGATGNARQVTELMTLETR
ncbi:Tubulin binding cofactor C [Carpediemonas membranifera]|uniref:TBCC domain-containing protein 1 n=1 Tax=Carpediemonas membranifera TaxID=201153 RepID=A0A8J6AQ49_9EUKA|nr:Tubulin binding cofactor C [Carpediemonas membranifera]|eukprot:KAG9390976.1 Tubulin binding cofactor C [Carpediemonas membranifera]